jgi:hypothetical protein
MTMETAEAIFEEILRDGIDAIDEFIDGRLPESLFLDFKKSADQGRGRHLHESDRNNFSAAVSGFGNSEGGVIVWGVECHRDSSGADVPSQKVPLEDAAKFAGWLEDAVHTATSPPSRRTISKAIRTGIDNQGFVVTLIRKNIGPPLYDTRGNKFLIRAGSSFIATPPSVLAGLFGQRPQPRVYVMWATKAESTDTGLVVALTLMFHNEGPSVAREMWLKAHFTSTPNDHFYNGCKLIETSWHSGSVTDRLVSFVAAVDHRLGPGGTRMLCTFDLRIAPPFERAFALDAALGCDGAVPYPIDIHVTAAELSERYSATDWSNLSPNQLVLAVGRLLDLSEPES